jgi:hypothetical protein
MPIRLPSSLDYSLPPESTTLEAVCYLDWAQALPATASVLNKSNVLSNESNKSNQIKSNIGILRFIKSNLSHRFDLKNI